MTKTVGTNYHSFIKSKYLKASLTVAAAAIFLIWAFMSGVVIYGEYQKRHLLKYIEQSSLNNVDLTFIDDKRA